MLQTTMMSLESKRREKGGSIIQTLTAILIGIGLCLSWGYMAGSIKSSYQLPATIQTFDQYLAYAGNPNSVILLQNDHFAVSRKVPGWHIALTVPSSNPAYVFDQKGYLADWSADPGDDGEYQRRRSPMKSILTAAEARELIEFANRQQ